MGGRAHSWMFHIPRPVKILNGFPIRDTRFRRSSVAQIRRFGAARPAMLVDGAGAQVTAATRATNTRGNDHALRPVIGVDAHRADKGSCAIAAQWTNTAQTVWPWSAPRATARTKMYRPYAQV